MLCSDVLGDRAVYCLCLTVMSFLECLCENFVHDLSHTAIIRHRSRLPHLHLDDGTSNLTCQHALRTGMLAGVV